MSNVTGPKGSWGSYERFNPTRTEDNKDTSDAPITDMGKLSGDYGSFGNRFFRKVYDSVAALFTGKYWKGGWFAPKQSGNEGDGKLLSGRMSSVSSDSSRSSSLTSDDTDESNVAQTLLTSQHAQDYEVNLQRIAAQNLHASINAEKTLLTKPSNDKNDDVEFTNEEVASMAAARKERRGYAYASDLEKIQQANAQVKELIKAATNPDINDNSRQIRIPSKQKRDQILSSLNDLLRTLGETTTYALDAKTISELDNAGLSYNSEARTISLKKN